MFNFPRVIPVRGKIAFELKTVGLLDYSAEFFILLILRTSLPFSFGAFVITS